MAFKPIALTIIVVVPILSFTMGWHLLDVACRGAGVTTYNLSDRSAGSAAATVAL
jgi:hypothetical protein